MLKFKLLLLISLVFAGTVGAMQSDGLGEQLYEAACNGQHEVVISLLDHGAAVNHVNSYGWTPLIYAAREGHQRVVQVLLDRGAFVNYEDTKKCTALMWATSCERPQVVQLLLDRGAQANRVSIDGWTALMYAANWRDLSCCEAIIDHLMRMPNETQREKIYQLLMHMKRSGCINKDIRNSFKPLFLQIIEEENREHPEHSIAIREIRKIKIESMKLNLLEKYTPMKKNDEGSNENK